MTHEGTYIVPAPGGEPAFWLQEALAYDTGESCPPLGAKIAVDVCVVGAGFAGLWTAIELAERDRSLRVALLDADICGGGASGRNGGFLSSSWWDLPAICGLFGEDEGIRYCTVLADAVGEAEVWCREHGVDCWFHHEGTLGVRSGAWQKDVGHGDDDPVEFCASHGLGDRLARLTAEEARAYVDSPLFVGGFFERDGATVQPARLARGLRRVALERGVHVFERTEVLGVEPRRPAVVRTERGAVRADQVVITTGAWAAAWPQFRRSFGNIADFMVVTEPIPERLEEIGWTTHVGIADGRELLYYLRKTEDDRVAIGGGATGVLYGGRIGRRATHDRRIAEVAARGLIRMFPQLEGVRFTHAWGGPIDHTASFLPFFETLPPGNLHAGLGFSGHGLAQTKVGGKILASLALSVRDDWTSLPVVGPEIAEAPPEPLRFPLVRLAAWGLESGDRREESGRSRGFVRSLIGNAPMMYRERLVKSGRGRR